MSGVKLPKQENIRCTRHQGKASEPAYAKYACLSCSRYLCPACDKLAHAAEDTKKHHRFPVEKLKSYIAFDAPKKANESHARRSLLDRNAPTTVPFHGLNTLYHTFKRAVSLYGDKPCLGQRTVDAQGKISSYKWITYKQVAARANNFGNGLRDLGLSPKARVGLYSLNRPEWVIGEIGCFNHNMVPVPLYDTLGPDAAEHVIKQGGLSAVVCSADRVNTLHQIAARCPELKFVVVMPLQPFDNKDKIPKVTATSSLQVLQFVQVEERGKAKPIAHSPPTAGDLCTICYTSGTTGEPKGAMITHGNMVSNFAGVVAHGIHAAPGDYHISYLPLAHVFERCVFSMMLAHGAGAGFARGDPLLLLDDVAELRPTIFVGVPRLYNRLYDKVVSTIDEAGGVKKWLFNQAFASKKANLVANGEVTSFLWDKLVFGNVAARLGGRVRLMMTGSAPISEAVMHFLRICFSCAVVEGYGQTEATCGVSITPISDQQTVGNVGVPLVCSEIKLVDVEDMGYTNRDVVNGVPTPRGEVCIRGANMFVGYYKDLEKTKETIDEDGWLHSGDIGAWLPDGTLKIIDRKKNIFKLAQGEYIAPEKIEGVYTRAKLIGQIFVHGDSLQTQLVAVVVPDEEEAKSWATKNKIQGSFADVCKNPALKTAILAEMNQVAAQYKLRGFEVVKAIHVTSEAFTVQNNLLTPTFKLKRNLAKKLYDGELTKMYEALNKATPAAAPPAPAAAGPIKAKL